MNSENPMKKITKKFDKMGTKCKKLMKNHLKNC